MARKNHLHDAVQHFAEAKLAKELAEAEYKQAQDTLLLALGDQKTTTAQIELDGVLLRATATKVQGSRIVIDEPALKKRLGAAIWNKVTKRVVDKLKLEDAISRGDVDAVDVAACSEEVMSRPYVKLSEKREGKVVDRHPVVRR